MGTETGENRNLHSFGLKSRIACKDATLLWPMVFIDCMAPHTHNQRYFPRRVFFS